MHAQELIEDIDDLLPQTPAARPGGSLLVMAGLPGAGKSHIVRHLQRLVPCVVVSTDRVRLYVRGKPTYTAAEMVYMYEICYGIIDKRLRAGQRVVFDGSNYLAARRQRVADIAARNNAPLALGHVQASEPVTRARLTRRMSSGQDGDDLSDAGWVVYQWMVEAQEPIDGPHLVLDTSATPAGVLARRLYDYWMECEQTFASPDVHL